MLTAIPFFDQHAGERRAGELAALIGVEDLRLAMAGERVLKRLDPVTAHIPNLEPKAVCRASQPCDPPGRGTVTKL
jgi:hypothetical protein